MSVYIFSLMFSLMIGCIGKMMHAYRVGNTNAIALCTGFPLFLVAALRYGIGQDYFSYVQLFHSLRRGFSLGQEYLYLELNRAILYFNADVQWVFVVCSAITIALVMLEIFRSSPMPLLSIFLFVATTLYAWSFNIVRQSVSCAVMFFALRYVERRQKIKFLICLLFAFGFHISAILLIVFYWFPKIKITPPRALIIVFLGGMSIPLMSKLFHMLLAYTPYGHYIGSAFDDDTVSYSGIALNLFLLFWASLFYKNTPKYQLYYNMFVVTVLVSFMTGHIPLAGRIRRYFMYPSIIGIPLFLKECKNTGERVLLTCFLIVMYIVYWYLLTVVREYGRVYPYQAIISLF